MRSPLNLLGVVLLLAGSLFLLQGLNVLPGSFMSGRPEWAFIGAAGVIAGAGLLLWSNRGGRAGR